MAGSQPTLMRRAAALLLACAVAAPAIAQEKTPPYWASIAASQAMMRTGPDRGYPAMWLYQRRDLPIRVLQIKDAWRQVQDQDGATGWMLAALLAARRTGVIAQGIHSIRDAPGLSARILWQAEGGVVGRISKCDGQYCRIEIGDKKGFIAQGELWGTDPGEQLP